MFRQNVGETGQIFTRDHPFIAEIGSVKAQQIRELAEKETRRWERKQVVDLLRDNLVGKTTTVDVDGYNATVNYSARRFMKAVSQPHRDQLDKTRAILNIEQVMKSGRFVKTAPNSNPVKNQVKQYHYLLVEVAGNESYIVLEEMNDGKVYFYSIVDSLKE